jgi:hypothetical protein
MASRCFIGCSKWLPVVFWLDEQMFSSKLPFCQTLRKLQSFVLPSIEVFFKTIFEVPISLVGLLWI